MNSSVKNPRWADESQKRLELFRTGMTYIEPMREKTAK